MRPTFPDDTPLEFKLLATACWDPAPENRPSFEHALSQLLAMRQARGTETPPVVLQVFSPGAASGTMVSNPAPFALLRRCGSVPQPSLLTSPTPPSRCSPRRPTASSCSSLPA